MVPKRIKHYLFSYWSKYLSCQESNGKIPAFALFLACQGLCVVDVWFI
jgi:hypothetical protein